VVARRALLAADVRTDRWQRLLTPPAAPPGGRLWWRLIVDWGSFSDLINGRPGWVQRPDRPNQSHRRDRVAKAADKGIAIGEYLKEHSEPLVRNQLCGSSWAGVEGTR
jgi:hypothetical protein